VKEEFMGRVLRYEFYDTGISGDTTRIVEDQIVDLMETFTM